MFGVGVPEISVLGVVVVLLIIGLRLLPTTRWVRVDDATTVGVAPGELDQHLLRLLDRLPASRVVPTGENSWMLTVSRAPGWAVVVAVALFPVGLLCLLARDRADLHISVRPASGGSEVRVLGTTRRNLADAIGEAVTGLA